mmetsp:Transcript_49968/g.128946  ORF Transcript_49968/g.128946 Transcript_49968/m.128946 type:complete len:246 (+) Transcript_49968:3-740(+)
MRRPAPAAISCCTARSFACLALACSCASSASKRCSSWAKWRSSSCLASCSAPACVLRAWLAARSCSPLASSTPIASPWTSDAFSACWARMVRLLRSIASLSSAASFWPSSSRSRVAFEDCAAARRWTAPCRSSRSASSDAILAFSCRMTASSWRSLRCFCISVSLSCSRARLCVRRASFVALSFSSSRCSLPALWRHARAARALALPLCSAPLSCAARPASSRFRLTSASLRARAASFNCEVARG